MRKTITTALVGYLAFAGSALAVPDRVNGTITNIDLGKHEIVLSDGQSYTVPPNIKVDGLVKGARVAIVSEKLDGANVVQSISAS